MALTLYAHPFSSYCHKVLIALYENEVPFTYRKLDEPGAHAELTRFWPFARFPVLVDGDIPVMESSSIIEHLGLQHPGPMRLVPADPGAALAVRFMDRAFDLYVHTPTQKIVGDALRPVEKRDATGVAEARATLDTAYAWLEQRIGSSWAAGSAFTLADCAAAPALFYSDWAHRIGDRYPQLRAYRARLNARPSYSRAIEEARPYRHLFPLGAPDRD